MRVVVGVITDAQQRVLITRRALHQACGGMWEFPGGKLEQGETASEALLREIKEEVNLDVLAYVNWGEVCYTINQKPITLLIYHVTNFQGEAVCCEKQLGMQWVPLQELARYQFPPANVEIVNMIHTCLNASEPCHQSVKQT